MSEGSALHSRRRKVTAGVVLVLAMNGRISIGHAGPCAFDYQGIEIGQKKEQVESARTAVDCSPDSTLERVETCKLEARGDEGAIIAKFQDGVLIELDVTYAGGMVRKHDLVAAQLQKKFGVKPKREKLQDQYDPYLRYNQSTFRRGPFAAVLRSADSSAVAATYGVKLDEDNNFILIIKNDQAVSRITAAKKANSAKMEQARKHHAAEHMKF